MSSNRNRPIYVRFSGWNRPILYWFLNKLGPYYEAK